MDPDHNYIVVTPVKNERAQLHGLLESMTAQQPLPVMWLIVDDCSSDGSYEIIDEWQKAHQWIRILRLKDQRPREIGFHYSEVTKAGFEYMSEIVSLENVEYNYIALVDADINLPPDYFYQLFRKFHIYPKLGIASGILLSRSRNGYVREKEPPEWPLGAARVWRRSCFEKTAWTITFAPDSVSTVRAMLAGYETRNFDDIVVLQNRLTYSGSGLWNGYYDMGRSRYYLGYSIFYGFLATIRFLLSYPFYIGIAFCYGYFSYFVTCQDRINDPKIVDFFEIRMISKMKNWLKRVTVKEKKSK